jgi:hypothetical protein
MLVGILECPGRFVRDAERELDRELVLAAQPVAERLALDERHGEPELAGRFAGVVDGEDVGVLQACGEADLALKPLRAERESQLRVQHFERHGPVVPEVLSEIDRSHPAASKLALELVSVAQGGGEGRRHWGQRD